MVALRALKVPAAHGIAAIEAAGQKLPLGHVIHESSEVSASAVPYVPAGHAFCVGLPASCAAVGFYLQVFFN